MLSIVLLLFGFIYGTNGDWQLVWSDEFNGNSLNHSEWDYSVGGTGWGNNELEYYTSNRTENARVENGHLVLQARVEDMGGRNFTSAKLNSKTAWAYGKFEARAKLPIGKHLWPAIWLVPRDRAYGAWAASGEIDIMEGRGEEPNITSGTIHYGGVKENGTFSTSDKHDTGKDLTTDYHVFGLEWDKNSFKWLVDGQVYHTENINRNLWSGKDKNPYDHNGAPFDKPFHWIVNIAVGGTFFPGDPNVTTEEARHWKKPTMEFDYLRVYQWHNGTL